MSTSLSTRIAGEFLGAGLMIGSSALAGYVYPEVGAEEGAIYGAFVYLMGRPVARLINSSTSAGEEGASNIVKVISAAGVFFTGNACSWAITNAIAREADKFSYTEGLALGGISAGFGLAIVFPVVIPVACLAARDSRREAATLDALDVSIANLRIAVDRHRAAQAAASSETATQVPVTVAVAMSV